MKVKREWKSLLEWLLAELEEELSRLQRETESKAEWLWQLMEEIQRMLDE